MLEPGNTTIQVANWLVRLRQGDKDACQALLLHSCGRLRKLTHRMFRRFPQLHRWEQTDDVLQQALLRLYRALQKTVPESPLHFFNLAGLQIRRELLDLAKHYFGPQGHGENHDSHRGEINDGNYTANGALVEANSFEPATLEEWSEFHRQVDLLPEKERVVVNLLWYQGLSQREAADALGISERNFARRWKIGRVKIQEALFEKFGDEYGIP